MPYEATSMEDGRPRLWARRRSPRREDFAQFSAQNLPWGCSG